MFGRQRIRLLRESPWTAQGLAEELYAMLDDDIPLEHNGPLSLDPDNQGIVLRNFQDGDTVFTVKDSSGNTIGTIPFNQADAPEDSTLGGTGSGSRGRGTLMRVGAVGARSGSTYSLTIGTESASGTRIEGDVDGFDVPDGTQVLVAETSSGNYFSFPIPSSMPGQVVSGSGTDYTVAVYPYSLSTSTNVSVRQLSNHGLDLEPGRWVTVGRLLSGEFFMQAQIREVFPGKITGGGGSSYTVDLYPAGLSGTASSQSVTQMQISPSATIPANTYVIVTLTTDGSFQMQHPVWRVA